MRPAGGVNGKGLRVPFGKRRSRLVAAPWAVRSERPFFSCLRNDVKQIRQGKLCGFHGI
jgi:hypothetical protein